jgi:hypothetical protein
MSPALIEFTHKKREILCTFNGMLGELEANRLLLLAIMEERPYLALEVHKKLVILENYISCINFSLDLYQKSSCLCFPQKSCNCSKNAA